MRCQTVRKNMFLFLENKLPEEKAIKMKAHIKSCAWCMADYKKANKMMESLRGGNPKMVPENLHESIMIEVNGLKSFNEVEKKENKIALIKSVRRAGVVFAAAFLVVFALQFVNLDMLKEDGISGIMQISQNATAMLEGARGSDVNPDSKMSFSKSIKKEEQLAKTESVAVFDDANEKDTLIESKNLDEQYSDMNLAAFATTDEYSLLLDDVNISRISAIRLYSANFDDVVHDIKKITKEAKGNIYYQNIKNDISSDNEDYRIGIFALKVSEDKLDKVKEDIEKLGIYDVDIEQEEIKADSSKNLDDLLLECKNQKALLTSELEDASESKKAEIRTQISACNESIKNLEKQLSQKENTFEVAKLEITLKECSEIDFDGIISNKTFGSLIKKSFKNGYESFVRMMQDLFIWTCKNILFILLYFGLFVIVFVILKNIFLKDKE